MPILERSAIFSKDLLLDTGVMKSIFHISNPEKEAAFWESVFRLNFYNKKEPFFITTLTMTLECLGYKPAEFDPFQQEPTLRDEIITILKAADPSDMANPWTEAMKVILGWYQRSPLFSKNTLQTRLQSELQHRSDYSKGLFITLFGSNIDRDYSISLNRMAFSTLVAFDYRVVGLDAKVVKALDLYRKSSLVPV
jgi:hypothetical protein